MASPHTGGAGGEFSPTLQAAELAARWRETTHWGVIRLFTRERVSVSWRLSTMPRGAWFLPHHPAVLGPHD
jgi:hypothetical protein